MGPPITMILVVLMLSIDIRENEKKKKKIDMNIQSLLIQIISKRIFHVQARSLRSKCQNYYNHQTFIIQVLHRPNLQNIYIHTQYYNI